MVSYDYSKFINHPFIQQHKDKPKWTVSTMNGTKMPCDMLDLMTRDVIRGADFYDEQSLTTLAKVDNVFFQRTGSPAPNHTFYLEAAMDGFCILDIEPTCPEDLKNQLLQMDYIYGEVSMSGKGYHLVFPLPECYMEYESATQKPALKDGDKNYEILLNHFCTFTGVVIDPPVNPQNSFEDLYRKLAQQAKEIEKQKEIIIHSLEERPDTEHAGEILVLLNNAAKQWKKTPEDFRDTAKGQPDMSRYEWACAAFLRCKLNSILRISDIQREHTYTDEEQAYFLYEILKDKLPHRPKHDTFRGSIGGMKLPWLGYLVKSVIEKIPEDE